MPKYYHGTSADNLKSILENGFDGTKGNEIWSVSGGANYFWSVEHIKENEEMDSECAESEAKRRAFESAECGLARVKDCRRVVFEIETASEFEDSNFKQDNSCLNMEGAVVSDSVIPADRIVRYWIDENDLSFFRPYFASIIHNRDLANPLDLTDAELAMVKCIQKMDSCAIFEALSELQDEAVEMKP